MAARGGAPAVGRAWPHSGCHTYCGWGRGRIPTTPNTMQHHDAAGSAHRLGELYMPKHNINLMVLTDAFYEQRYALIHAAVYCYELMCDAMHVKLLLFVDDNV